MAKIMIVDDDRTTVDLLKTLLELDGFEVFAVPDGEMAFQRAQELRPDIFLVDYHLSDFEGTEFVKQLRTDSMFASTPVIMTSGLNREDEANASGANSFLIKPFDPADLIPMVLGIYRDQTVPEGRELEVGAVRRARCDSVLRRSREDRLRPLPRRPRRGAVLQRMLHR